VEVELVEALVEDPVEDPEVLELSEEPVDVVDDPAAVDVVAPAAPEVVEPAEVEAAEPEEELLEQSVELPAPTVMIPVWTIVPVWSLRLNTISVLAAKAGVYVREVPVWEPRSWRVVPVSVPEVMKSW